MKSLVFSPFTLLLAAYLTSCSTAPHPIAYGTDGCHYCKMTIVDKQHAAEIVTEKGKPFKYDAIECMMNDLNRRKDESIALYLVADYAQPGDLLDATQAHYIISEAIPSPMGEFLSAFAKEEAARAKITALGGDYFTWTELIKEFE